MAFTPPAGNRMVALQRPARRFQRPQRESDRDNPLTGIPWGQETWPGQLDFQVFGETPGPFADLATLKADGTFGDGVLAYNDGADFLSGQFVVLEDASQAHYNTDIWVAGAAP